MASNRLFVGGLDFSATGEDLRASFEQCGEVMDVHILTDRLTGKSKDCALVELSSESGALAAMQVLQGAMICGRPIRVKAAEPRPERPGRAGRVLKRLSA